MRASCAEVNIGIICSCLPILPIFYKHVVRTAKEKFSKPSTYYELEPVWKGGTGVERVRPDAINTKSRPGRAESEPALHQQYLGFSGGYKQEPPFLISQGAAYHDPGGRLWSGDGIMKTVQLERVEESFALDGEPEYGLPATPNATIPPSESFISEPRRNISG